MANGMKRFTSLKNLESIRKSWWTLLCNEHQAALAAKGVSWPMETLPDEEYYEALKAIFLSSKPLPDELDDFLCMVAEMANAPGEDRLRKAMARAGKVLNPDGDSSLLEIVLQIGLAQPVLLRTQHGEHQLFAVSSFQYFATKTSLLNRQEFRQPPAEAKAALEKALDREFTAHQRGRNTVRVTPYELEGEYWYVIDHGGTMHRERTTDDGVRGVVHFRPDEHDLVVYNAKRDEVRINAGSDWQREAYRTEFGKFLRADYHYFNLRKNFTLEPLRKDVEEALSVRDFPNMEEVLLVEVGICYDGEFADVEVIKSKNRVASAEQLSEKLGKVIPAVPEEGRLAWAVFEIADPNPKNKPRKVHLRLPNALRVPRFSDARQILEWLTDRGYRDNEEDVAAPVQRSVRPASSVAPGGEPQLQPVRSNPAQN